MSIVHASLKRTKPALAGWQGTFEKLVLGKAGLRVLFAHVGTQGKMKQRLAWYWNRNYTLKQRCNLMGRKF